MTTHNESFPKHVLVTFCIVLIPITALCEDLPAETQRLLTTLWQEHDASHIVREGKVVELMLRGASRETIRLCGHFTDLRRVDIVKSALSTEDLSPISNLKNLQELWLHDVSIDGNLFLVLANLYKLETLISNDGNISSLAGIGRCKRLRLLEITGANIKEGWEELAELSDLRQLNLFSTTCGDSVVAPLQKLTRLRTLVLTRTLISARGIEALKQMNRLIYLDVSDVNVPDDTLESLRDSLTDTLVIASSLRNTEPSDAP